LTLSEPYNTASVTLTAEPGHQTIAVVTIDNLKAYKKNDNEFLSN
jgi:hypothetical protein